MQARSSTPRTVSSDSRHPGKRGVLLVLFLVFAGLSSTTLTAPVSDKAEIKGSTTIREGGSYVLKRDIIAGDCLNIVIMASHVTIDLGGHTLDASGPSCGPVISSLDSVSDIHIKNGTILS